MKQELLNRYKRPARQAKKCISCGAEHYEDTPWCRKEKCKLIYDQKWFGHGERKHQRPKKFKLEKLNKKEITHGPVR